MTALCVAAGIAVPYIARGPHRASDRIERRAVDWFYMYFIGFLILIAAVALAMGKLGIGAEWILIVCLALLGVAVMSAVTHSRGGGGQ